MLRRDSGKDDCTMIAGAVGSEGMRFMNIFTGWGDITRTLQLPSPFRCSFVVSLLSPRFAVETNTEM